MIVEFKNYTDQKNDKLFENQLYKMQTSQLENCLDPSMKIYYAQVYFSEKSVKLRKNLKYQDAFIILKRMVSRLMNLK